MAAEVPHNFYLNILSRTHPSMRYDGSESFEIWQAKARAKLDSLLNVNREPCADEYSVEFSEQHEGYAETRFTFLSEPGWTVPCHMLIPDGAQGKLPVMICLQGHSTGMHISLGKAKFDGDNISVTDGDRDFAVQAVERGYIAIALEQRCFGEMGGNPKPTCYVPSMTALLTGRTVLGGRVRDISKLINVIEAHIPQADCTNISCMGNSGGGTATIYAACLDERIKAAMPSCALCTYRRSIAAVHHCACNFVPGIANFFDMGDLCGLIAPRRLVIVSGKTDGIFPLDGAEECVEIARQLYTFAGAPEKISWVVGEAGHRFYAAPGWAEFSRKV